MTDEEVRFGIIDDPHAKPADEVFWRDVRVVMPRRHQRHPPGVYEGPYRLLTPSADGSRVGGP